MFARSLHSRSLQDCLMLRRCVKAVNLAAHSRQYDQHVCDCNRRDASPVNHHRDSGKRSSDNCIHMPEEYQNRVKLFQLRYFCFGFRCCQCLLPTSGTREHVCNKKPFGMQIGRWFYHYLLSLIGIELSGPNCRAIHLDLPSSTGTNSPNFKTGAGSSGWYSTLYDNSWALSPNCFLRLQRSLQRERRMQAL